MATQNLSTPATEGNTPEPKYYTRYGITTASDAALDLLDRACFRAAYDYYYGDDKTPGKVGDAPEVKP
jgi:hypothetical protein